MPCIAPVCIQEGHFFLARPVHGVLGDGIDPSYRYATTRPDSKEVHTGVEMPAAFGDPVAAAAAGVVAVTGDDKTVQYGTWLNYYGNLVILEHRFDGYPAVYSLYAHLSEVLVSAGQEVQAGDVIGKVGASGAATGPHLHFEVRAGSLALENTRNPELWLIPHPSSAGAGGALAGRITGPDGLPRKVESISVQPLDASGQPAGLALYTRTYDKKFGHPDDLYAENFALGDLPPGPYLVSFVDAGRVWRETVAIQPESVTRVDFQVTYLY